MYLIKGKQKGLTLLELMIVIAIIGILAAIAISGYQHYSNSANFGELIQGTAPFKLAVNKAENQSKGYVASIEVGKNAQILATSQRIRVNKVDHFTYILTPIYQTNGQLRWDVSGTCLQQGLCKGE